MNQPVDKTAEDILKNATKLHEFYLKQETELFKAASDEFNNLRRDSKTIHEMRVISFIWLVFSLITIILIKIYKSCGKIFQKNYFNKINSNNTRYAYCQNKETIYYNKVCHEQVRVVLKNLTGDADYLKNIQKVIWNFIINFFMFKLQAQQLTILIIFQNLLNIVLLTKESVKSNVEECLKSFLYKCPLQNILSTIHDTEIWIYRTLIDVNRAKDRIKISKYLTTDNEGIKNVNEYLEVLKEC